MLKKIGVIVVVLLVAAGTVRSCVQLQNDAELTVNVLLVAEGSDVTQDVRLRVGIVPDAPYVRPTLGNTRLLSPRDRTENVFDVPANQDIGIFVLAEGIEPISNVIRLSSGELKTENIVLERSLIRLTVFRPRVVNAPIIVHFAPNSDTGRQFFANKTVSLLLPAGTHRFKVKDIEEIVEVEVGEIYDLEIDTAISTN